MAGVKRRRGALASTGRGGKRRKQKEWGRKQIAASQLSFTEARDFIRRLGLRSHKEWQEWSKSGQRPSNVPSAPDKVYKGKGWVSWPDWMGYQYAKGGQRRKDMLSFQDARNTPRPSLQGQGLGSWPDWMGYQYTKGDEHRKDTLSFEDAREVVRRVGMTSRKEWNEWSKSGQRPSNVPGNPGEAYKGKGWVSYPDWMGYQYTKGDETRKEVLPFQDARETVRRLGLTSEKEWKEWSKSGQRPSNVPSTPDRVYKGKGWVSWPDWMGYQFAVGDQNKKRKSQQMASVKRRRGALASTGSGGKRRKQKEWGRKQIAASQLSFTEARDFIRRLRLRSNKEWKEWSKSGQRPSNVPSNPARLYKGKGWVSYPDWMGYQYTKGDQTRKKVLSFQDARETVRRLGLTSEREWREWSKSGQRPCNVPGNPDQVYKGKGWVSYPDWMGYQYTKGDQTRKDMLSFQDARERARRLGLTSKKEWKEWSKSGQRPSNVPSKPDEVYKGKGWVSWPDWMGYQFTKGDQFRKDMLSFEDARETVRRLGLTSKKEWKEWSKSGQRPSNVPGSPDEVYKGKGWVSYPDWMGYQFTKGDQFRKDMLFFEDGREVVRRLGLTSMKEWKERREEGAKASRPSR
eukprot:g3069.t1